MNQFVVTEGPCWPTSDTQARRMRVVCESQTVPQSFAPYAVDCKPNTSTHSSSSLRARFRRAKRTPISRVDQATAQYRSLCKPASSHQTPSCIAFDFAPPCGTSHDRCTTYLGYSSRFGYVLKPYIKEKDIQAQIMLSFFAVACRRRFHPSSYTALKNNSFTYDHRILRIRLPVRSAIYKQDTGGLVVRWVTTSESPLLYVLGPPFCCMNEQHLSFCQTKEEAKEASA
jgi:hypothetical protein